MYFSMHILLHFLFKPENERKQNVYAKISNFMNLLLLPHTDEEQLIFFNKPKSLCLEKGSEKVAPLKMTQALMRLRFL